MPTSSAQEKNVRMSLSGLLANGTYDVAKTDYHPLLFQGTIACQQGTVSRDRPLPVL